MLFFYFFHLKKNNLKKYQFPRNIEQHIYFQHWSELEMFIEQQIRILV